MTTNSWAWTDDHHQVTTDARNAGYTHIKTAAGWRLLGEWATSLQPDHRLCFRFMPCTARSDGHGPAIIDAPVSLRWDADHIFGIWPLGRIDELPFPMVLP